MNGSVITNKAQKNYQTTVNRAWYKKPKTWLILLLTIVILLILWRIISTSFFATKSIKQALPVVVATAHSNTVPVYLSALGTVTPSTNVTVKTQINGQLWRVLFQEGQIVKAGDLLAEIDPRPYQAQLKQYEGQLARDTALLANAQLDLKRYQKLYKLDSVSQQTLATQESLVKQDEGIVKLDQGLIDSTKVNLAYCEITAPTNGRVGLRQVDPGNVVQISDPNGIVVLDTLNPISVIFSVPEDNVPTIMQQLNNSKTLMVEAYDRSQTQLLATGILLTIDNQVDSSTGTVKLKAIFQNDDNHLFPNQFVNVKLLINTLHNATIIPTAAIQPGIKNTYVYLLNNDYTVTAKTVTTSVTSGENTVITEGVIPGEFVVTEGADKLSDGVAVKVSNPIPASTNTHPTKHRSNSA